jgi:demethylmenaquinone methyltransferase/2-methoxy-6-polyprenyl-1,4-benzoquinol methylase
MTAPDRTAASGARPPDAGDILAAPVSVRRRWVQEAFHSIAGRYDLLNHLLSGGTHLAWKRAAVRAANLAPDAVSLDLCCGTADLPLLISRLLGPRGRAIGLDFAPGMLDVAAHRLRAASRRAPVALVCADAEAVPLRDQSIDAATFAFGLRNVADPSQALREVHRLLRPGGRLVILEFGQPSARWLRTLYDLYSQMIIPRLGGWLSGRPDAYQYLHDSIRQWPDANSLSELIRAAGFVDVGYRLLTGGIAVLHAGVRPRAPGEPSTDWSR